MTARWKKYTLNFKRPSGTSRGILKTKDSYFLIIEKEGQKGIGECGLLRGLSADDRPDYEEKLDWLCHSIDRPFDKLYEGLKEFPSIQFGLEMALKDWSSKDHIIFPSELTTGEEKQPINGLIWMGSVAFMKNQVKEKLDQGFTVLKMKIGAIGFDNELTILKEIRKEFKANELELRVDANGGFMFSEAKDVLTQLADLSVHSIEQPIQPNQWQEMAALCESPPTSIALDEELIGVFDNKDKVKLLETIKPQYIILKPSFIGGFRGSEEWISLAQERNTGWWTTSALESNLGLSAIAQWNFTLKNPMPSGLGTGSLYTNNFPGPLFIKDGQVGYNPNINWDLSSLEVAP